MNYIILDLEWNQSSEGKEEISKVLPFEIIEIGAIKLNNEKEMIGEFSQLIKPEVYHQMHYITKKLIHLQMEELEKGKPFKEVITNFLNWCGKEDYIFCTWGPLDLLEMQRNMRYYELPSLSDGPLPFLDIQKLFSIAFEDKKSRRTLEYAVDYLKVEKDIPFHRAFSDAYYTAKVFSIMKRDSCEKIDLESQFSYDLFSLPKSRKEEIHVVFGDYAKYISREFEDRTQAIEDREVISTRCYFCHKNLRRKVKWFSNNGKHYYSVAQCDKHGYMKGKIRIKKSENEKVFIVKTLKFISVEDAESIRCRQTKGKNYKKSKPLL